MGWIPKESVLVPVDLSDESLAALDTALDLVENPSHLHVIHVLPPLSAASPGVVWEAVTEASAIEHATQRARSELAVRGCAESHLLVTLGSPASEIIDHAERVGADLIVIPSHGRTGLRRLFIGSVAEKVVRHAHCPVLVLRT
ncbi:universal stress protein [bacterium]|nr:universal stress protein [bacterium]